MLIDVCNNGLYFIYLFCLNYRKFAQKIPRDFGVRYNPYTQSVDILDSPRQMKDLLREVHQEMNLLLNAMDKL